MAKKQPKKSSKPASKIAKKHTSKPSKSVSKKTQPQKTPKASPKFRSPYPRAALNPFRIGSVYAATFDALASKPEGMTRQDLITKVAKITGKDERHANFDVAVILSAKQNGERHQSCRPGFWVERQGDHCLLRTP